MCTISAVRTALLCGALLLSGCTAEALPVGLVVNPWAREAALAAAAAPGSGRVVLQLQEPVAVGAEAALDAALRLLQLKVVAVVGHSNSEASLAASQVYNRARVVQIAPTSTATAYEQAGEYSFRLVPSDREQAALLARAALHVGNRGPVAVMYENDDYGYGLLRDLRSAADSLGLSLAGVAAYLGDEPTPVLAGVLAALLAQRPSALVWLGRGAHLQPLLPALRAARVPVIGSDGLDRLATANQNGSFTGVHFVRLLDPAVQARAAAALAGRTAAEPISAEALLVYDAVGLVRAAHSAGALQGSEIRNYLLSLGRTRPSYPGITGPIHFDENRTLRRSWQLALVGESGLSAVRLAP